jgi:hypothetical protein
MAGAKAESIAIAIAMISMPILQPGASSSSTRPETVKAPVFV